MILVLIGGLIVVFVVPVCCRILDPNLENSDVHVSFFAAPADLFFSSVKGVVMQTPTRSSVQPLPLSLQIDSQSYVCVGAQMADSRVEIQTLHKMFECFNKFSFHVLGHFVKC